MITQITECEAIQFIKDGLAAGAAQVDGVYYFDNFFKKYMVRFNAGIELKECHGIACSDRSASKCYMMTASKFNRIRADYNLYELRLPNLGKA